MALFSIAEIQIFLEVTSQKESYFFVTCNFSPQESYIYARSEAATTAATTGEIMVWAVQLPGCIFVEIILLQ